MGNYTPFENIVSTYGLIVAYILVAAAVLALVIFPVYNLFKGNFGKAKGTLLGVGALVAVILISYLISPAEQGPFYEKMDVGPGASKLIGAGLYSTYFIALGFVIITLYTSVSKWFK
jgi:NADH:ubiquinone oxidoreductase subunit 6 (subunit J)